VAARLEIATAMKFEKRMANSLMRITVL
jgi:hypothetical protein